MVEIKDVRNFILNNIDDHDQPSRMHRSPPRSPKFPDSKNSKIDKSHWYFRFYYSVLVEIKVVRNGILNNLYPDDKLPILNCSPSGSFQSLPDSQI